MKGVVWWMQLDAIKYFILVSLKQLEETIGLRTFRKPHRGLYAHEDVHRTANKTRNQQDRKTRAGSSHGVRLRLIC